MSISGTPTVGNDNITVTAPGTDYVDGLAGTDNLTIDWSSLTHDIAWWGGWGQGRFTDDFFNTVAFNNFETVTFKGGSGNDDLRTTNGNDQLFGNAGDDNLSSGLGADIIDGGTGNDRWSVDYGSLLTNVSVVVPAAAATDYYTVTATGAKVKGIEALSITTGAGADIIDTSAYQQDDWIVTNAGNDTVKVGAGRDYADGGAGTDELVLDWSGSTQGIVYTSEEWWRSQFQDGLADPVWTMDARYFERFDLTGGSGADDLRGGSLNDRLIGNAGNDTLYGRQGIDIIDGGTGTDRWIGDFSNILQNVTVSINVAAGVAATVKFGSAASGAVVKNVEALDLDTGSGADTVTTMTGIYNDTIETRGGDDTVSVSRGKDYADGGDGTDTLIMNWTGAGAISVESQEWWRTVYKSTSGDRLDARYFERFNLTGSTGKDDLHGGALADTLVGGAGNDRLNSGAGLDSVNGGTGTADLWIADQSANTKAILFDATGSQTAAQGTGAGLSIRGIEALSLSAGSGSDSLSTAGFALNDRILGNGGNDVINPGRGFDYASGDGDAGVTAGLDKLVLDWSDATGNIVYTNEEWYRRIFQDDNGSAPITRSLEARNFEQWDLTGGAGNDDLRGGGSNDRLIGNAGADTLAGRGGQDSIDGGEGNDRWIGDLSAFADDVVFDAGASQTVAQGTGVGLSILGIEALDLTGGTGNDQISTAGYALNDTIRGSAGNDVINPGRGFDYATGDGDGGVTAGLDKLVLDWSDATGNIVYTNEEWYRRILQDDNWTGTTTRSLEARNFEQWDLTGGAGDDNLRGADSNDRLIGNGGNDTLDGRGGLDIIDGGVGNDVWAGNLGAILESIAFSAVASQTAAQGTAVGLSVSNVEALNLTSGLGDDNLSTAGYALDDRILGNSGDDIINPGGGNDYVSGDGDGGVTAGTDKLVLDWSTATAGIVYTNEEWYRRNFQTGAEDPANSIEARNFEQWDLTGGSGNDDLRGGDSNDRLVGNAGSDVLYGRGGVDTIIGGSGVDLFQGNYGGSIANIKLTLSAGGNGTIQGVGTTLSGVERIQLTTGAGADTISTAALARNDQISTGTGNDTINVGKGTYDYADGGTGTDTLIADMSTATSGIRWVSAGAFGNRFQDASGSYKLDYGNFEVYQFTGSAYNDKLSGWVNADSLVGGAGDDRLEGSHGDDQLTGGTGADQFYFGQWWANGRDTIRDAEAGDFLRVSGVTMAGSVTSGDGTTLGAGGVQVETNTVDGHAVTTVHVGCDGAAGADLHIDLLDATIGAAGFQLSGSDIRIIQGSTTTPTPGDDLFNGTTGDDTLDGGAGNDILNGGDGDDLLVGGAGLDRLNGGAGQDNMTGGSEKDIFVFASLTDSTRGPARDVIADFSTADGDQIDVKAIDANPVLAGDQAFKLVSTFTGAAGQMRFDTADHLVQFDQNGDGVADFEIEVIGVNSMTAADFVL